MEKDEHGFYAWCPELRGANRKGILSKKRWQTFERPSSYILKPFAPRSATST
jgi:hypothetical protein